MITPAPIVVGIDGTDTALAAARWAADHARRTRISLRLVHSMPNPEWYLGSVADVSEKRILDEMQTVGGRHLETAANAVRGVDPSGDVETVTTESPIAEYVAHVEATMVVLGSGRSGPVRDIVMGGNSIRVVNRARCPVMIRREEPGSGHGPDRPVVVGVDGSPESDQALVAALEFARTAGAPVLAANYWGLVAKVGVGMGAGYVDWDSVRRTEHQWLTEHIRPFCEKFPEVTVEAVSSDTSPSSSLRSLSTSAQLMVVGSRGRGRVAGAFLGSVSQNLVHHSHCSVLVVR